DVFARATLVAVDNLPGVQNLSREFITRYGKGDWSAVTLLSTLIGSGRKRTANDDVTLFKAMGMGISDLALGTELVRRARDRGVGRTLAQPKKAKPRLAARKKRAEEGMNEFRKEIEKLNGRFEDRSGATPA